MSSPFRVHKRLKFICRNIPLFPALNLMQASAKQHWLINHKRSAECGTLRWKPRSLFSARWTKNDIVTYVGAHSKTSHHSFIKETVSTVLLNLPEGWWVFVHLYPILCFFNLGAFPNCFKRDYKTLCCPGSHKLQQRSNDTVDNKSWTE